MVISRACYQVAAICITTLSFLIWIFHSSAGGGSTQHQVLRNQHESKFPFSSPVIPSPSLDNVQLRDAIHDILNQTLGFQKIYAISMPHRTDKRDYLALMGYVSNLQIDFIDGVNGSEMHPKSHPSFWKGTASTGDYGVWRAHLNIYQHMLSHNIQTALILEDDADWDILLRHQMLDFAHGARAIQNSSLLNPALHSPYGDTWDLLALGHIGANNKPNKVQKYWITQNDITVIPSQKRTWSRIPDFSAPALAEGKDEQMRVVMEVSKFTGAAAYGISLRGAARLLYDQALLPNAQAIDVAMLALCRHASSSDPFLCLGAYPMLFGRYRAIGPETKDSDRRSSSNEVVPGSGGFQDQKERVEARSEFTVFPVSLNLGGLLTGERKFVANVDGVQEGKERFEIDLAEYVFPKGREVLVGPEEYVARQSKINRKERVKKEQ
ncbi:unnamed protein product [Periconia digitata]|uniref:Glycosyl transferase family 25 domain-containing protein n=1 Tax=Periconia digitata TaxID=1303443 RepID=A0A9W4XWL8_9PLEO|nr:unnamed protein product [Periconia digitata]